MERARAGNGPVSLIWVGGTLGGNWGRSSWKGPCSVSEDQEKLGVLQKTEGLRNYEDGDAKLKARHQVLPVNSKVCACVRKTYTC